MEQNMATTLVDQTYDKLLEMIVQEGYKPGDRFPSEMVLCETLNVSRNTLRAALNKLNALGFTESRQGGGTFVKEVGTEVYLNFFVPALLSHNLSMLEIMRFRKGIEVEIARQAAEEATEDQIKELRVLLENCRQQAGNKNMSGFASANSDFHAMLAEASGNTMFVEIMKIIRLLLLPEMQAFLDDQKSDIDSNFYHEMILCCVIDRKPTEAAFFMERHMEVVVDRVRKYVTGE